MISWKLTLACILFQKLFVASVFVVDTFDTSISCWYRNSRIPAGRGTVSFKLAGSRAALIKSSRHPCLEQNVPIKRRNYRLCVIKAALSFPDRGSTVPIGLQINQIPIPCPSNVPIKSGLKLESTNLNRKADCRYVQHGDYGRRCPADHF